MSRMSGSDWALLVGVMGVIVAAVGLFLGVPTWKLQRHAERQQAVQDRQVQLTEDLNSILAGPMADQPRSPANPSILDALRELRNVLTEVAELSADLGWHISDNHGPQRPPWGRK